MSTEGMSTEELSDETPGLAEDDVEGHRYVRRSDDPDSQAPSHTVRATDDDEDVEGHIKVL